jgi:hypothetical protein
MQNFEKLGAFYLGKRIDSNSGERLDELVLYDSKDLTTHAAIIGMTGSGKTGLGIGLIEEAAMDRIPVIAVDPKGDLGNLLLTFPQFKGEQFEPWVDGHAATEAGQSKREYAAAQAAMWKKGLAGDGQTPARLRQLKAACDFVIYTPGSLTGTPIAVLGDLTPPAPEVRDDADVYNDLIEGSVTSILTLLGIDGDPVMSKEHILVSNILRHCWDNDQSIDLAGLIAAIQAPAFRKIGVIDIDTFFPPKERFKLAMQINNLLAAPGFAAWLEGSPLNIDKLFFTDTGQPRVAILSIAHLDDRERMFFVTMLLNALLAWMRRQTGSSALRAMLYIDELFGYMPPVANPPSKKALLTLLKQARAFGLGLVLSTQNPVDLDYKGMSNMGTWFIGRLQTQRDKKRLLDGLNSASGASDIEPKKLSALISDLGKRSFLLHNVHEQGPVLFSTRWVMSYLAGPLSRTQIRKLIAKKYTAAGTGVSAPANHKVTQTKEVKTTAKALRDKAPVFEPGVRKCWLGADRMLRVGESLVYEPALYAELTTTYTNARARIDETENFSLLLTVDESDDQPYWDEADELVVSTVKRLKKAAAGATYLTCPSPLCSAANHKAWENKLKGWIRTDRPLQLLKSASMKNISRAGESERDFRIRLQQLANEQRDIAAGKLRDRYAQKVARLEDRLLSAEQALDREAEQASGSKLDAALSVGTAILGSLLGRKRISATSVSRVGTAARRTGNMRKQLGDVKRAEARINKIVQDIEDLKVRCDKEVAALADAYDAQHDQLEEVLVRARSTNIRINWFGIGWRPVFSESADT